MFVKLEGSIYKIHFDEENWQLRYPSIYKSFGDIDPSHIIDYPESYVYFLQSDDEFIVMAPNKLWQVFNDNNEVINFIKNHIKNKFYNINEQYPSMNTKMSCSISRNLINYAIAKGATGKFNVLIIIFDQNN